MLRLAPPCNMYKGCIHLYIVYENEFHHDGLCLFLHGCCMCLKELIDQVTVHMLIYIFIHMHAVVFALSFYMPFKFHLILKRQVNVIGTQLSSCYIDIIVDQPLVAPFDLFCTSCQSTCLFKTKFIYNMAIIVYRSWFPRYPSFQMCLLISMTSSTNCKYSQFSGMP